MQRFLTYNIETIYRGIGILCTGILVAIAVWITIQFINNITDNLTFWGVKMVKDDRPSIVEFFNVFFCAIMGSTLIRGTWGLIHMIKEYNSFMLATDDLALLVSLLIASALDVIFINGTYWLFSTSTNFMVIPIPGIWSPIFLGIICIAMLVKLIWEGITSVDGETDGMFSIRYNLREVFRNHYNYFTQELRYKYDLLNRALNK